MADWVGYGCKAEGHADYYCKVSACATPKQPWGGVHRIVRLHELLVFPCSLCTPSPLLGPPAAAAAAAPEACPCSSMTSTF